MTKFAYATCSTRRVKPCRLRVTEPAVTWRPTAQSVLSLVKDIEIVGEAAAQVTESTRIELPDIPWSQIVAMRNRVVHAYFNVNLDIVWQTVKKDLPLLIAGLERFVPPESGRD